MLSYQSVEIKTEPRNDDYQKASGRKWKSAGLMIGLLFIVVSAATLGRSKFSQQLEMDTPLTREQIGANKAGSDVMVAQQAFTTVQCGDTLTGTVATAHAKVFYEFTVPDSRGGVVTLDTCGSSLDTYLYVYTGAQTSSAHYSCDDCGPCGYQTVQPFVIETGGGNLLAPNTLYTIGVGAYSTRTGPYTLKISCDIVCGSTVTGATVPNGKIAYNLVVPSAGTVTMSTCLSNFDTWLYTYVRNAAGTEVLKYSCDDCGHRTCGGGLLYRTNQVFTIDATGNGPVPAGGSGSTSLQAGIKYTIKIGGFRSAAGTTKLGLTCAAPGPAPAPAPAPGCGTTVRRDWNGISQAERDLFLNGFKALRANGRLAAFLAEHEEAVAAGMDGYSFHGNDAFLPWHRYFLFELERQIRALGGAYACFSLPYWDWSRTAGQMVSMNPMWTQGLGGNGSPCVTTGLLASGQYTVTSGGCLSRSFRTNAPNNYPTIQEAMGYVETVQAFSGFSSTLEGKHGNTHTSIGGILGNAFTATDDPLFWMLHNYVDMIWAMRSDCHGYGTAQSTNNFPDTGRTLRYPILAQQTWARASTNTYTASDMLTTTAWNYVYHASNMVARSGMAMGTCTWTNIQHAVAADSFKQENGDGKVAFFVNNHIRALADLTDAEKTKQACLATQRRELQLGIISHVCTYGGVALQTCGPTGVRLQVTLATLLAKRGVAGNPCIEQIRRDNYAFARQIGDLRALCNGAYDAVC